MGGHKQSLGGARPPAPPPPPVATALGEIFKVSKSNQVRLWFDFVINAPEVKFSFVGKLKRNKDEEKLWNNSLSGASKSQNVMFWSETIIKSKGSWAIVTFLELSHNISSLKLLFSVSSVELLNLLTQINDFSVEVLNSFNRCEQENESQSVSQRFILSKSYSIEKVQYNNIHTY